MSEVLTPQSHRWPEFAARLSDVLTVSATSWRCDGDQGQLVHRHSKDVMTEMGDFDIPATLDFFKKSRRLL
jgi:hypothetical protein